MKINAKHVLMLPLALNVIVITIFQEVIVMQQEAAQQLVNMVQEVLMDLEFVTVN